MWLLQRLAPGPATLPPFEAPLQAPFKPPSSPLQAPFKALKPLKPPSRASKPFEAPSKAWEALEAPFEGFDPSTLRPPPPRGGTPSKGASKPSKPSKASKGAWGKGVRNQPRVMSQKARKNPQKSPKSEQQGTSTSSLKLKVHLVHKDEHVQQKVHDSYCQPSPERINGITSNPARSYCQPSPERINGVIGNPASCCPHPPRVFFFGRVTRRTRAPWTMGLVTYRPSCCRLAGIKVETMTIPEQTKQ